MPTQAVIKPSNAASIWITDGTIYLELSGIGGARAHTVALIDSCDSWLTVRNMMHSRTESSRLGEPGDPTQHHIDKSIPSYDESRVKRAKPKFSTEVIDGAKDVLRRMGLI